MDRTIELMAGQETIPAETPAGGTLSTDFGEQLILLGNRLTAIEAAIVKLTKQLDSESEPDTEPNTETETPPEETEPEPEQESQADETEPDQETPAESED